MRETKKKSHNKVILRATSRGWKKAFISPFKKKEKTLSSLSLFQVYVLWYVGVFGCVRRAFEVETHSDDRECVVYVIALY